MLFLDRLPLAACLVGLGLSYSLTSQRAIAQTSLPVCPAPSSQEYLLLVRGNTEDDRNRIASVLPAESTVLICNYLNEVLVRAGGFTSLETANAWATYMNTVEGFESFVARPVAGQPVSEQPVAAEPVSEQPVATEPVSEQPIAELPVPEPLATEQPIPAPPDAEQPMTAEPTAESGGVYQPQRLAAGYVVLVDFGDRPEVASAVEEITAPVGLAVYQQRPYLLAAYTQNEADAEATLQELKDASLPNVIVVNAEEVVQLSIDVIR